MNKKKIEKLLPLALETLKDEANCKISEQGKILKAYRSAISSFGAAVTMGSFRAAVSFFSKDADSGDAGIQRSRLLCAIDHMLYHTEDHIWNDAKTICGEIVSEDDENLLKQTQNDYLHAAVALKLAMNAFDLIDGKSKSAKEA